MSGRVVVLCGGVGGAKLALGMSRIVGPGELCVVVNTADDFEHLGLMISPDIDTVTYTLAGIADPVAGWGREDESWACMAALEQLGGETWFRLGDRDLALHLARTALLRRGQSLTAVTAEMAKRLGVHARILPMTDARVQTKVETEQGALPFQHYFVREQCRPQVKAIVFNGIGAASPTPEVRTALLDRSLAAIVLAPSNPFLSLDPILAVPGLRELLQFSVTPVIGIAPLAGERAFKGPTVKIMQELGVRVGADAIAERYRDILDGFIVDSADAGLAPRIAALGIAVECTPVAMPDIAAKMRLAQSALSLAETCRT